MKRARAKIQGADRSQPSVRDGVVDLIEALNPFLRGWGTHFRTGNAATKFRQLDRYVTWRLKRLMITKRGRNLRAGQADVGRGLVQRARPAPTAWHHPLPEGGVTMSRRSSVSRMPEGAADKAATQLVRVQPCQLSVSDMKRRHCPVWVTGRVLRGVKGLAARRRVVAHSAAVGATWGSSERRSPKVIE